MPPVETAPGLPAPFWFIELFKILGFVLHSVPMNIWLVGLPLVLLLTAIGGANANRFSKRLFKQFPVILAIGINLGIVPLLFVQTAYYKPFYSATILIAVHWLAILALVLIAYYLIYACSFDVERPRKRRTIVAASVVCICLIAVGLIFASGWSLMESPSDWIPVWEKTSIGGGVSGLGTYWNNPLVYLRFGSVFGIACLTTAFWIVFDSCVLCRKLPSLPFGQTEAAVPVSKPTERPLAAVQSSSRPQVDDSIAKMSKNEKRRALKNGTITKAQFDASEAAEAARDSGGSATGKAGSRPKATGSAKAKAESGPATLATYRNWTLKLASRLAWIGLLIAGATLYFYYEKAIPASATLTERLGDSAFYRAMGDSWFWLKTGTLIALAAFPLILSLGRRFLPRFLLVFLLTISEFAVLIFFATTRQMIQNDRLIGYWNVARFDSPAAVQWNPLFCFLAIFGVGVLVILWMIVQMAIAARRSDRPEQPAQPK